MRILAKVCLLIGLYYFTYFLYSSLQNTIPALGDSWDYHIPISQSILNGSFINPQNFKLPQWYYPGSSEAINSVFILLKIPLTLSNLFAITVLFFALLKLGAVFKLSKYFNIIFALSFVTLNGILRWANAVGIDLWVAVFYVTTLIFLEKPKNELKYFALLGFFLGMLVGSKYSAVLLLLPLFIVYAKTLFKNINLKKLIAFLIPFSIFGLFWYIRNYLATGNPFYPLPIFGFKGIEIFQELRVWNVALLYPKAFFDAGFAEYKIWLFALPFALIWIVNRVYEKQKLTWHLDKIFILGLLNFLIFLFLPSSKDPWIMVSSFRYSYPTYILLILGVFLVAQNNKREEIIGYITIAGMIMVTSMSYHPKLILFYLPLAIVIYNFLDQQK